MDTYASNRRIVSATGTNYSKLTEFGLNITYNCYIDNNINLFVILNEVKNLFLHRCILFSFIGQMLPLRLRSGLKAIFAQHDSKK